MNRVQKWQILLDKETRTKLERCAGSNQATEQLRKRARVLLETDTNNGRLPPPMRIIAQKIGVTQTTVIAIRRKFCEQGIQGILYNRYKKDNLFDKTDWSVYLDNKTRQAIINIISNKKIDEITKKRARILLESDKNNNHASDKSNNLNENNSYNESDSGKHKSTTHKSMNLHKIAQSCGVSISTVMKIRRNFACYGLEKAIFRKRNKPSTQKYNFTLNQTEKNRLKRMLKSSRVSDAGKRKAQLLLAVNENNKTRAKTLKQLSIEFSMAESTITAIKRKFVLGGLDMAVNRKKFGNNNQ